MPNQINFSRQDLLKHVYEELKKLSKTYGGLVQDFTRNEKKYTCDFTVKRTNKTYKNIKVYTSTQPKDFGGNTAISKKVLEDTDIHYIVFIILDGHTYVFKREELSDLCESANCGRKHINTILNSMDLGVLASGLINNYTRIFIEP